MGFKIIEIKLPLSFTVEELRSKIKKKLKTSQFSHTIEKQSLDARDKRNIHWLLRVGVSSPALRGPARAEEKRIEIPYKKRDKKIVVVGSGPAGFFCAYTLALAGFDVALLEQGSPVGARLGRVTAFERTGELDERDNYCFGEGGAGTFSDGKLTSRTKSIKAERRFIYQCYIEAGAPEEVGYLAHPHLGSDNLVKMVKNLRQKYLDRGGTFLFNTMASDMYLRNGSVSAVETEKGKLEADYFVFATGHSAYKTYRMFFKKGIPFQVKPFALGCRVEHPRELVNQSRWGRATLPGIEAADYRLTWKDKNHLAVYSFCMCPGGQVVPAAAYKGLNIVNGKSDYARNRPLSNAGIVAAVDLNKLLKKEIDPLQALEWLEHLERMFYDFSGSYAAPACRIEDFLTGKISSSLPACSYPFELLPADFTELLPAEVTRSLQAGMTNFSKQLKGFEKGIMLGLESKTSSPIQAVRDRSSRSPAADNLYICGEGSGWAGGIVSSAADGIKAATAIISGS